MKQRTFEEIKGKPLIYLTVEEFISLQETLGKEDGSSSFFPEIMSIDDAAKFTGYKKSTLYRKTCTNAIPFYRQGSRVLFSAYSGDTRSPFPVISVHFLFIFLLAGVKLVLFS